MAKKPAGNNMEEVHVVKIEKGEITFHILGTSALLSNAFTNKAARELLLPEAKAEKKAKREERLKHNPPEEFRDSLYRSKDASSPTLIEYHAAAPKRAMATAAMEFGTTSKAQISRLCWVLGPRIPIWGVPQLSMMMVRQAGMARTPDIRTRAILPEWATKITVQHVMPKIKPQAVANLVAAGGFFVGIGDGRNEKGALSFGSFELVDADDERWQRVVGYGGRAAQEEALADPTCYDLETEELLDWWHAEVRRRGFKIA